MCFSRAASLIAQRAGRIPACATHHPTAHHEMAKAETEVDPMDLDIEVDKFVLPGDILKLALYSFLFHNLVHFFIFLALSYLVILLSLSPPTSTGSSLYHLYHLLYHPLK